MGNKISTPNIHIHIPGTKRKKQPEVKYLIRVNDVQIDRIQQMHHVLKTCSKGNYFSPVKKALKRGIKVLDVGSGPGTWIFDMSSDYPKSEFIGIEYQAFMLPTVHPSNTNFVHKNILEGIPFSQNTFDYIFMRNMTLCFTEQQYGEIIQELIGLLKPNGYLELCEPELCSKNMGPISERFSTEIGKLLRKRSMNPFINEQLGDLLSQCGLQEIDQNDVEVPTSELDGSIGKVYGEIVYNGILGMKDILAKQMNLSKVAIEKLLEDYREEVKIRRMYGKYTRVYGRKYVKDPDPEPEPVEIPDL